MNFSKIGVKFQRIVFIVTVICTSREKAFSQTDQNLVSTALHRVIFEKSDTIYNFYVVQAEKGMTISNDLIYSWYAPDTVLQTHGGYGRFVLNGNYTVFYPNKNLREEGTYSFGLKVGEWKNWYPNGVLNSSINWKKGKKQGKFVIYSENSEILRTGEYNNDLLDGHIVEVTSDNKAIKRKYKKGKLKMDDSTSVKLDQSSDIQ